MNRELLEILEEVHTEVSKDNYQLYSNYGPSKQWNVDDSKVSKFWKAYCGLVDKDFMGSYNLAEIPQKIMPLILDFNFRFSQDEEGREYFDNNVIYCLIQICQNSIQSIFETSLDKKELICCYLESEDYWEEDSFGTKNEKVFDCVKVRFQFPFCRIKVEKDYEKIHQDILLRISESRIHKLFGIKPEDKWNTILKKDTMKTPITMYGSTKYDDTPKLQLKNTFYYISGEDFDMSGVRLYVGEIPTVELEDIFDFRQHKHCLSKWINRNLFTERMDIEFWLPLYLSIEYFYNQPIMKQIKTIRKNKGKERKNDVFLITPQNTPSSPELNEYLEGDNEELLICKDLLPLLKPFRFIQQNFWEEVAQAIHSSSSGSPKGLAILEEYTSRHCSYRESECRNYYRSISDSYITHKTIGWYAREDNCRGYKEWHKRWYLESMEDSLSALDNDVAKALYRFYWLDFLCTYQGKSRYVTWWEFKNHTWRESPSDGPLRTKISREFYRSFENLQSQFGREIATSTDEALRATLQLNIKKICNLLKKLKTYSTKTTFMREVSEFFVFYDFNKIIDENDNLTGTKNGVIEVCREDCIFRPGKPEDYITKSTICKYDSELSYDDPLVQETLEWINQVFPDKDLARHFLKYCSSFLKGGNREKFFVVFSGGGHNSKSMICKLFGLFGSYCIKMPLSCITSSRSRRGGPTPELARARAARVAIMQEPEKEEVIRGGMLKEMTGGDVFYARFLNDNGGEIRNTFKLILQCNGIPAFNDVDQAVKDRTRIFPFLSRWEDNAPEDPEEQYRTRTFQKNKFFEDRIKILQPAFLWLCKEYYPSYMKEGLDDPPIIKEYTDKYWRDNDVYVQYIMARITQAKTPKGDTDKKASLTVSKIYNDFKMFMSENYPNNIIPDIKLVKDKLSEKDKLGKIYGNSWNGIRFKEHTVDLSHLKSHDILSGSSMDGRHEGSSEGVGLIGL